MKEAGFEPLEPYPARALRGGAATWCAAARPPRGWATSHRAVKAGACAAPAGFRFPPMKPSA
ncbi:hypothetical protein KCMC57_up01160 [Kitasatospora sp. CMC57]